MASEKICFSQEKVIGFRTGADMKWVKNCLTDRSLKAIVNAELWPKKSVTRVSSYAIHQWSGSKYKTAPDDICRWHYGHWNSKEWDSRVPDVANTVWLGQTSVFYCTKMFLTNPEQKPGQAWHCQLWIGPSNLQVLAWVLGWILEAVYSSHSHILRHMVTKLERV